MKKNYEIVTKDSREVFDLEEYLDIVELIQWLQEQRDMGATHVELKQDYVGNTLTTSMKFD